MTSTESMKTDRLKDNVFKKRYLIFLQTSGFYRQLWQLWQLLSNALVKTSISGRPRGDGGTPAGYPERLCAFLQ
jgi:DNA modification methylase